MLLCVNDRSWEGWLNNNLPAGMEMIVPEISRVTHRPYDGLGGTSELRLHLFNRRRTFSKWVCRFAFSFVIDSIIAREWPLLASYLLNWKFYSFLMILNIYIFCINIAVAFINLLHGVTNITVQMLVLSWAFCFKFYNDVKKTFYYFVGSADCVNLVLY